jgi:Phosphodiester glycosidase
MAGTRFSSSWIRLLGGTVGLVAGAGGLVVGCFFVWTTYRAQPAPTREDWYRGVHYERIVLRRPRPVVAHVVRIDLAEPGIDFVVTAGEPSRSGDVRAQTTSGFAAQHGVQLAINASYFYPFVNNHPLDYEPHVGDPVYVVGPMAARGVPYGRPGEGTATLHLSRARQITFDRPSGQLWNAISGMGYVVRDGALAAFTKDIHTSVPYPRCLIGVTQTGGHLLLLIVDGKQPGYSEGVTLDEAARILLSAGAWTGIQLDGGGSATLVRRIGAHVHRVSTPANFRIPGWERPVATHLGIYARMMRE